MAGASVNIGTGTTIAFGTSSFTAELLDVGHSGNSRPSIETSHMGTPAPGAGTYSNATFLPGDIVIGGQYDFEFHYDPDEIPPINGVTETITLTFPLVAGDTTPTIFTFQGFMMEVGETIPLEDKMTMTATVIVSDAITVTAAT